MEFGEGEALHIASKLKKLRKQKGLTQEEAAKALNIAKSTLGNYEIGRRAPDLPMLIKLADFYGVSLDYFRMSGNGQSQPWWERDEPPTDIELMEFIREHSNLRRMGYPLDEDAKEDVLLFLRAAYDHMKREREAKKRKAAEAAQKKDEGKD
ncbi:MAG: helix-turn-helix domain-containing protein [Thermanaerothrix sp.]|nr:helix-turn-helix domain-containing protein [Thermanaerothrix sp.]